MSHRRKKRETGYYAATEAARLERLSARLLGSGSGSGKGKAEPETTGEKAGEEVEEAVEDAEGDAQMTEGEEYFLHQADSGSS